MQIEKRKVVTIDYTLTDDSGDILDTSKDNEPLTYLHGTGSLVVGLERALEGKTSGDELKVKVDPIDGYGERDERLVQEIPRERFPNEELEIGMRFEVRGEQGELLVTVVSLDEKTVTLDGNHPLAGISLTFEVSVRAVRDATLEELKHGHVHGEGGHSH